MRTTSARSRRTYPQRSETAGGRPYRSAWGRATGSSDEATDDAPEAWDGETAGGRTRSRGLPTRLIGVIALVLVLIAGLLIVALPAREGTPRRARRTSARRTAAPARAPAAIPASATTARAPAAPAPTRRNAPAACSAAGRAVAVTAPAVPETTPAQARSGRAPGAPAASAEPLLSREQWAKVNAYTDALKRYAAITGPLNEHPFTVLAALPHEERLKRYAGLGQGLPVLGRLAQELPLPTALRDDLVKFYAESAAEWPDVCEAVAHAGDAQSPSRQVLQAFMRFKERTQALHGRLRTPAAQTEFSRMDLEPQPYPELFDLLIDCTYTIYEQ